MERAEDVRVLLKQWASFQTQAFVCLDKHLNYLHYYTTSQKMRGHGEPIDVHKPEDASSIPWVLKLLGSLKHQSHCRAASQVTQALWRVEKRRPTAFSTLRYGECRTRPRSKSSGLCEGMMAPDLPLSCSVHMCFPCVTHWLYQQLNKNLEQIVYKFSFCVYPYASSPASPRRQPWIFWPETRESTMKSNKFTKKKELAKGFHFPLCCGSRVYEGSHPPIPLYLAHTHSTIDPALHGWLHYKSNLRNCMENNIFSFQPQKTHIPQKHMETEKTAVER